MRNFAVRHLKMQRDATTTTTRTIANEQRRQLNKHWESNDLEMLFQKRNMAFYYINMINMYKMLLLIRIYKYIFINS